MRRTIYAFAKTRIGGMLLHWIFSFLGFAIPTERLIETKTSPAFYHPSPSSAFLAAIVPKAKIGSLHELNSSDQAFMVDLFESVEDLVNRFQLTSVGYRLVANGGSAQGADYLHFRLISDPSGEE